MSYYEINVSVECEEGSTFMGKTPRKTSKHVFATAPRSIQSVFQLRQVLPLILEKFPESEGYNVTVTRHEEIGYGMTIEEALKD